MKTKMITRDYVLGLTLGELAEKLQGAETEIRKIDGSYTACVSRGNRTSHAKSMSPFDAFTAAVVLALREIETFCLLECSCAHAFVRGTRQQDWSCPACGSTAGPEPLLDVPGPARDKVGVAELRRLREGSRRAH